MKSEQSFKKLCWVSLLLASNAIVGCGGGSSDSNSSAATDSSSTEAGTSTAASTGDITESLTAAISSNTLAEAFPGTLALSVFPQSINTTVSVSLTDDANQKDSRSPVEKLDETVSIISGNADSCLPASLAKDALGEVTNSCYEFDSDMIYSTSVQGGQTRTLGTKDGTDGNGEACMVSFARGKMQSAVSLVERAKDRFAALLCQAKKDGAAENLPAIGATLDLKANLEKVMAGKVDAVNVASIQRLEDVDSRPVYKMTISITDSKGGTSYTREMNLVNSPGADAETFDGVLWVRRSSSGGGAKLAEGPLQQTEKDRLFSVVYSGSSDDGTGNPKLTYELRKAKVHVDLVSSAFTDSGVLDVNVGRDFSVASTDRNYGAHKKVDGSYYAQSNDAIEGINYIAFEVNPQTNAGNISYWQNPGGRYTEPTRGMVFNAEQDLDSGKLKGCAVSGASGSFSDGISIGSSIKNGQTLIPASYWHPFLNTSNQMNNWVVAPVLLVDANGDSFYQGSANGPVPGQQSIVKSWYIPKITDSAVASTFVTESNGNYITRQCFVQNDDGVYTIDTGSISQAAGYEIISGTSESRPKPPNRELARGVGGKIK